MLPEKECRRIPVLLVESHKNSELKSPHRRSARGLVADLDTVYYNTL